MKLSIRDIKELKNARDELRGIDRYLTSIIERSEKEDGEIDKEFLWEQKTAASNIKAILYNVYYGVYNVKSGVL